ncbi:site-specific integrase [Nonomuraea sp. NPDC026600]|uniref:tyrosine-type recombinase/integrase n=1 Tax=Nonomuraea sp. NPDC026600 TaxID=3155363 RepID=UPI0033D7B63C
MTFSSPLLPVLNPARESRDRLELLTALINGPDFEPLLRDDVIHIPPNHPDYGWGCRVADCQRVSEIGKGLCSAHGQEWAALAEQGGQLEKFLQTALPREALVLTSPGNCLVEQCARPAQRRQRRLCFRHSNNWASAKRSSTADTDFDEWISRQKPLPSYGNCLVASCDDLAFNPLGLCEDHYGLYHRMGRPGAAELPAKWFWNFDRYGLKTPVQFDDETAFRTWCRTTPPPTRLGVLNLRGMHPLMQAELRWSLFSHARRSDRSNWHLQVVQGVIAECRSARSLDQLDTARITRRDHQQMIEGIRRELRIIYVTPADTREAGYLQLDHFGRRPTRLAPELDLTMLPQRWLRDLLWDYFADTLRSPSSTRAATFFHTLRRACQELAAFLDMAAENRGLDPRLLEEDDVHRFIADMRRRSRDRLTSLATASQKKPTTMTEVTQKRILDDLRKLFRWVLDQDQCDSRGLKRSFIRAFPSGVKTTPRTRSPFSDDIAEALADPVNLAKLDTHDPADRGMRDMWTLIVATGRRASEVRELRLDCVRRVNRVPLLWHDQTKVGNYDEAIRIPEYAHQRVLERQQQTTALFVRRFGRAPMPQERPRLALFSSNARNPRGERAVSANWFNQTFRDWVAELDLGRQVVPHQARHTLATKLLAAGAGLHHIKRFLGHVSERMTEHYAKVALSEIDDVLQHVWVSGPGAGLPGELLSEGVTLLPPEQAQALVIDLNRRSTPTDGGICTFQVVVDGGVCPWKLDCENCDKFVMTGADLLYWRRKRDQWHSLAERAPTDEMADWLHQQFEPTRRAIEGLEQALAGLGLLEDALALDLRRPQDYFHRLWSTGFRTTDLAAIGTRQDTP